MYIYFDINFNFYKWKLFFNITVVHNLVRHFRSHLVHGWILKTRETLQQTMLPFHTTKEVLWRWKLMKHWALQQQYLQFSMLILIILSGKLNIQVRVYLIISNIYFMSYRFYQKLKLNFKITISIYYYFNE